MNIYISNLSYQITDEDLKDLFAEYGEVTSAKVITDKFTGDSRGFGFVEMTNEEEANKAVSELDKSKWDGRNINVSVARPKEEKPRNGGGERRSFSGNGGGNSGGGFRNRY
jgi:RNA recognition motif-containing protein